MLRMIASGTVLLGNPNGWRDKCGAALAQGPPPLSPAARDQHRYAMTDLLDDLHHAVDPGERTAIAAVAWIAAAQHALALADHWTGTGKWLLRELRDLDEDLAARWLNANGDHVATAALIRDVLDLHGRPLFDGHHVPGERPG